MKAFTLLIGLFISLSLTAQDISRSMGVLSLNENYEESDWIELYNEDGSSWVRLNLYQSPEHPDFKQAVEKLDVFILDPDYFLFKIKCISKKGKYYKVLANEHTGLIKYMKVSPYLNFQYWEEYVLGAFSIKNDSDSNPLRSRAEGAPLNTSSISEETYLHPVQIRGDWLQVKWTPENTDSEGMYEYGWVRWRQMGSIIIEIFFFA